MVDVIAVFANVLKAGLNQIVRVAQATVRASRPMVLCVMEKVNVCVVSVCATKTRDTLDAHVKIVR